MLSVHLCKHCQPCPRGLNWPLHMKRISETMRLTTQVSDIGSLALLFPYRKRENHIVKNNWPDLKIIRHKRMYSLWVTFYQDSIDKHGHDMMTGGMFVTNEP